MPIVVGTNQPQTQNVQPVTFGPPKLKTQINAAVDAINRLRTGVNPPAQVGASVNTGFLARVHDPLEIVNATDPTQSLTAWKFTQVYEKTSGMWEDVPTGYASTNTNLWRAYELNNVSTVPSGARVWVEPQPISENGVTLFIFQYSQPGFWARLHDASGSVYQFTQVYESSAGTWADVANGLTGSANEANGTTGITDGTRVWVEAQISDPPTIPPLYAFQYVKSQSGVMFAVQVTKDGGSGESATVQATYTYSVSDITGTTTLGTGVPQTKPRPVGAMLYQTLSPGVWGSVLSE